MEEVFTKRIFNCNIGNCRVIPLTNPQTGSYRTNAVPIKLLKSV